PSQLPASAVSPVVSVPPPHPPPCCHILSPCSFCLMNALWASSSRSTWGFLVILILLLRSQGPGVQGQEFRFGPCRVQGVALQELREAFWTVKDTVQAKDNITSVRLLRKEVLQDVSDAESCYLIRALLKFYLNTVFKNYLDEAADVRIRRSFSTLANNFFVIASKLQPSEDEMFSISESARRRFLLFQRAFKQLDIQAAQTKAFGEVDILLTWMEKFYEF
uniref:Interleukin family protein n=1 Tax=Canis lupus dingo TaxID=286419 RepID=A0A8C0KHD7_CANLU